MHSKFGGNSAPLRFAGFIRTPFYFDSSWDLHQFYRFFNANKLQSHYRFRSSVIFRKSLFSNLVFNLQTTMWVQFLTIKTCFYTPTQLFFKCFTFLFVFWCGILIITSMNMYDHVCCNQFDNFSPIQTFPSYNPLPPSRSARPYTTYELDQIRHAQRLLVESFLSASD